MKLPFFSFRAKTLGVVLMLSGASGIYLFNYQNYKPDWLQFDVFTFYSSFLLTKTFTFIKNNQGDEISTVLFFLGAFLIMVSAEKNESQAHQPIRIRAMAWAAMASMFVFLFAYIFLHGLAITYAALALPYLIPLFYLAAFYILNKTDE
ncbi:MAG: hypothetical protein JZU47_02410 [Prolixibacteraceae bacterium]|nr:hypothetical protein [Prolixibacteraceae bacterium]